MSRIDAESLLRDMFSAAVSSADPFHKIGPVLPAKPPGRVVVVGAGKASARMAQAVEAAWGPCEGIVIVPHGAGLETQGIEIVEASHPVPDQAGVDAALRLLAMVEALGPGDMALCLISGGGSALMAAPGLGISLADKQAVTGALLASGAPISEMNIVRKHLSAVKGGRLAAAAYPALVVTLTISDVPGDDPAVIASGPTVPDMSTVEDARAIIARYRLTVPDSVAAFLATDAAETPKSGHPVFAQSETHLVATPMVALNAAAEVAQAAGVTPVILGDALEGEAEVVGQVMAGIAHGCLGHGTPARPPVALISGGETTVTLTGTPGKGGRNAQFLLGFARSAPPGACGIACDTDGIDGVSSAAGAVWVPRVAEAAQGMDKADYLARRDAWSFFHAAGGLVETGPTHTNVNDFRAILVL